MKKLNNTEYKARFSDPQLARSDLKEGDTRAGRALAYALDIRKNQHFATRVFLSITVLTLIIALKSLGIE